MVSNNEMQQLRSLKVTRGQRDARGSEGTSGCTGVLAIGQFPTSRGPKFVRRKFFARDK